MRGGGGLWPSNRKTAAARWLAGTLVMAGCVTGQAVDDADGSPVLDTPGSDSATGASYGSVCVDDDDCASGHCGLNICCPSGGSCCASDADCTLLRGCDLGESQCHVDCTSEAPDQDDDSQCAAGAHCEALAGGCVEDRETGECSADTDCGSGECKAGRCCQHEGLCCFEKTECSDLFSACDGDNRTCKYVSFFVAPTGQTSCFSGTTEYSCGNIAAGLDDYGQDGHYQTPRGYITDTPGVVGDTITKSEWTLVPSSAVNFTAAQAHCQDLTTAGGGWAVPNRFQLQSIVDYGVDTGSMLHGDFTLNAGSALFWSGTPVADQRASQRWVVNFDTGRIETLDGPSQAHVRCVRPGIGL